VVLRHPSCDKVFLPESQPIFSRFTVFGFGAFSGSEVNISGGRSKGRGQVLAPETFSAATRSIRWPHHLFKCRDLQSPSRDYQIG